jgi:hypothetical protein
MAPCLMPPSSTFAMGIATSPQPDTGLGSRRKLPIGGVARGGSAAPDRSKPLPHAIFCYGMCFPMSHIPNTPHLSHFVGLICSMLLQSVIAIWLFVLFRI